MSKMYICSSGGEVNSFPPLLKVPYQVNGIGLVVCQQGSFRFTLNRDSYSAHAGETLFIPEHSLIKITQESEDLEVFILIYDIEPIRDLMGNLVLSMYPYSLLSTEPCHVWNTGEEEEVTRYMRLLDSTLTRGEDLFAQNERKLLLIALTYRLCSIYSRKMMMQKGAIGRKHELFMKLVHLIEKHYMEERGVEFYADKLCLSPKYVSALSKSLSGYTAQELVFKAIVRRSIFLLLNTRKSIQEISDELHFPNASYFGTFFKKHIGVSPQQYRAVYEQESEG